MYKNQLSCATYFGVEKGRHKLYLKDVTGRHFLLSAEAFSVSDVRRLFRQDADFAYTIDTSRNGVQELAPSDVWQIGGLTELAKRTDSEINIYFDVFDDDEVA